MTYVKAAKNYSEFPRMKSTTPCSDAYLRSVAEFSSLGSQIGKARRTLAANSPIPTFFNRFASFFIHPPGRLK